MGLLSAVAVAFFLVIVGLSWVAAITASLHLLGVVCLIVAAVVLFDALWAHGRFYARRD